MDLFLQLLVYGAATGSVYGLVAIGFTVIYGATQHFHIAIAASFEAAAYVSYALTTRYDLPVLVSIAIGLASGIVVGPAVLVLLYRPIQRRGLSSFSLFVASLGAFTIIDNLFSIWLGADTLKVPTNSWWSQGMDAGGISISPLHIVAIVGGLLVTIGCVQISRRTQWGRLMRSLGDNPDLLGLLGHRSKSIEIGVYVLGSATVAVAGLYVGISSGASPNFGTGFVLVAFLAVFLGTVGSMSGAYVVALAFGIIQSTLQVAIPSVWSLTITFALFLTAIAVMTGGLNRVAARTS